MVRASKGSSARMRRKSSGATVDAADEADAQGREVDVAVGRIEQRHEHRGRSRECAHTLPLDQAEEGFGVEHRQRKCSRALLEARHPPCLVSEAVEERVHDEIPIARPQAEMTGPAGEGEERRAVLQHHALRAPGGARREDHVGDVVRTDRRDATGRLVGIHRVGTRQVVVERHVAARSAESVDSVEHDDPVEAAE